MLADTNFTEFRHFQTVISSACLTKRILTDTFTRFKFMFTQTPRQRADRTLIAWIPLFLRTLSASALKMLVCSVDAFDRRYLHILRMIRIVRSGGAKVFQMIDLVIQRHRLLTILSHLIPHLEHIVLQLFLVPKLRKEPLLLCFCRIRTISKCLFQSFSRITPLSPSQWEADTLPGGNAVNVCQRDTSIKPQLTKKVKRFFKKMLWSYTRGRIFLPRLKAGVSNP